MMSLFFDIAGRPQQRLYAYLRPAAFADDRIFEYRNRYSEVPVKDRADYIEYFRSLDKALDEHKAKGTRAGDPVYRFIHDELAEDLAPYGFGKDELRDVAERCGQLSTYERLEHLMPKHGDQQVSNAIRLLEQQLQRLSLIGNHRDPQFTVWQDTTTSLLQKFLSADSPHLKTFSRIRYRAQTAVRPLPYGYRGPVPMAHNVDPADIEAFNRGRDIAMACINSVIEELHNFGIQSKSGAPLPPPKQTGGFQQIFKGPVTIQNQAVATDNAIQDIGQMGTTGSDLKEIADLLKQSMELTGREQSEGLHAIEVIASEIKKPESTRDWKSILDWGEKLAGIASKATDLTVKLAPYMPAVVRFVEEAAKRLHF
jgi:hypothetical protein